MYLEAASNALGCHSGGELLQLLPSLIAKVILSIFSWASAQPPCAGPCNTTCPQKRKVEVCNCRASDEHALAHLLLQSTAPTLHSQACYCKAERQACAREIALATQRAKSALCLAKGLLQSKKTPNSRYASRRAEGPLEREREREREGPQAGG